jgi:hypothetical protein
LYFPKESENKSVKILSTDKLENTYLSADNFSKITKEMISDKLFLYLTNILSNSEKNDYGNLETIIFNNKNNDTSNIIHMLKNANIKFPFFISRKIHIDLYNDNVGKQRGFLEKKINLALDVYSSDYKEDRLKYMYLDLLSNRIGQSKNFDVNGQIEFLSMHIKKSNKSNDIDKLIDALEYIIDPEVKTSIKDFIEELSDFNFKTTHDMYCEVEKISDNFIKNYTNAVGENPMYNFSFNEEYSTGEESFLRIFSQLYKYIKDKKIICIDEIDNSLHPNWQKEIINYIIKFLSTNFCNNDFHLILTSHSPFILSDLPKQNIIFLEKDEKTGNCINATDKVDINPFGANIHTLLSHGFFMKDGLMGEFAKSKIDNVIKYLNNDKDTTISSDNDAQNIISIIGEPIIKRELQRMLKNKMELSNKEEIDTIKEEIEFLKHRIEILRKGK